MKTVILSLAGVMLCSFLHAQINKGQWMVGGNSNFTYTKTSRSDNSFTGNIKNTSLQLLPDVGYFLIDRLAAGLRSGITYSNNTANSTLKVNDVPYYEANSKSKVTSFILSPFVRYYFLPKTQKLNLLADIGYGYNHNSVDEALQTISYSSNSQTPEVIASSGKITSHSSSYTIAGGPSLFLNTKTALELTVGYIHTSNSGNNASSSNSLVIGVGFKIFIGK